jgi:hypothetical protein
MSFRILHYCSDPNYRLQYNLAEGEPAVSQVFSSDGRSRNEQPLGIVSIADFKQGLSLGIWHNQRRAVLDPIPGGAAAAKQAADFRNMLRNLAASGTEPLPDRTLNGRTMSAFLIRKQGADFTVTADPQTKLPVRMEVVYPKNPDGGQIHEVREVYTDFVFDAPLDDALFKLEAPQGYKFVNRTPRVGSPQPPEMVELVVSPTDGIGPVKFGTKVAEIVRLLGEPDWHDDADSSLPQTVQALPSPTMNRISSTELSYARRGFRLMANETGGLYRIECRSGSGDENIARDFQGTTKEGVRLGASLGDVVKAYGKPVAQQESRHLWYPSLGYEFGFRNEKLVSIEVSRPNPDIEIEAQGEHIIQRVKP